MIKDIVIAFYYILQLTDLEVKEENPDNWDNWNPWEDKGDGWFVRERKCRNDAPDGYCEGNSKQKRRIKIWTLISQWLVEDIGVVSDHKLQI